MTLQCSRTSDSSPCCFDNSPSYAQNRINFPKTISEFKCKDFIRPMFYITLLNNSRMIFEAFNRLGPEIWNSSFSVKFVVEVALKIVRYSDVKDLNTEYDTAVLSD